jgi:transposase
MVETHTLDFKIQYFVCPPLAVIQATWPSLSPDMAPIEHVWNALGRRVDNRPVKPTTGATLRQALLEEWNNMPQRVIQNIILSRAILLEDP